MAVTRLAFSLWLMTVTWIGEVVGLGFRPVGGGGVVSFMWVCSVGLCYIFGMGFDRVCYGWVLMVWVYHGSGSGSGFAAVGFFFVCLL